MWGSRLLGSKKLHPKQHNELKGSRLRIRATRFTLGASSEKPRSR